MAGKRGRVEGKKGGRVEDGKIKKLQITKKEKSLR